jgi:hypothetical protein
MFTIHVAGKQIMENNFCEKTFFSVVITVSRVHTELFSLKCEPRFVIF